MIRISCNDMKTNQIFVFLFGEYINFTLVWNFWWLTKKATYFPMLVLFFNGEAETLKTEKKAGRELTQPFLPSLQTLRLNTGALHTAGLCAWLCEGCFVKWHIKLPASHLLPSLAGCLTLLLQSGRRCSGVSGGGDWGAVRVDGGLAVKSRHLC